MAKSIEAQRLPYVSFTTWTRFLENLDSANLPSHIDSSYLQPLGYSGATGSSLRTSLRFFNLITDAGVPADTLKQLISSKEKERQGIYKKLIQDSYPSLIDLGRATPSELNEYLRKQGASGDSQRKCFSFIVGFCSEANVPTPHLKPSAGRRKSVRRPSTDHKNANEKPRQLQLPEPPPPPSEPSAVIPQAQHHNIAWLELFLKKYPDFDHEHPESHEQWHLGFQSMFQIIADLHRNGTDHGQTAGPLT